MIGETVGSVLPDAGGTVKKQMDLFASDPQPDLFAASGEDSVYVAPKVSANPDKVRVKLLNMLAELRAAADLPSAPPKLRLYQTIFPQMARWLPDEEAAQLCFAFEAEIERLEAA